MHACTIAFISMQVSGRRLQNHGGVVHQKGLIPAPLPSWLQPLVGRLGALLGQELYGGGAPNHVLVNAYAPGEGIMVRAPMHCMGTVAASCWAACNIGCTAARHDASMDDTAS